MYLIYFIEFAGTLLSDPINIINNFPHGLGEKS